MLALGRGKIPGFVLVATLVSLGTAASLVEPWIYRAIIDDVAGVFVEPLPLARVESVLENLGRSGKHIESSGRRVFHAPLRRTEPSAPRCTLAPRTVHQALATVLIGALLVVLVRAAGSRRALTVPVGLDASSTGSRAGR